MTSPGRSNVDLNREGLNLLLVQPISSATTLDELCHAILRSARSRGYLS